MILFSFAQYKTTITDIQVPTNKFRKNGQFYFDYTNININLGAVYIALNMWMWIAYNLRRGKNILKFKIHLKLNLRLPVQVQTLCPDSFNFKHEYLM